MKRLAVSLAALALLALLLPSFAEAATSVAPVAGNLQVPVVAQVPPVSSEAPVPIPVPTP